MTITTDLPDAAQLMQARYVQMWNETDPERRRALVKEVCAENILHRLQAPLEVHAAGRRVGVPNPTFDVVGLDEMRFRVDTAHEEFVASGVYEFRPDGPAALIGSTMLMGWQMIELATGARAGGGTDVLTLDAQGRIVIDYQFIDP